MEAPLPRYGGKAGMEAEETAVAWAPAVPLTPLVTPFLAMEVELEAKY